MDVRHDLVGGVLHERRFAVTAAGIEAYADAVGDPGQAYRGQAPVAPPLFSIVSGWEAMESSVRDVLDEDLVARILHLTQDMTFHRPIRAGDELVSKGRIAAVEGGRRATTVFAHCRTETADGSPVAEFVAGIYVYGHGGEDTTGDVPDDFRPPRGGEVVFALGQHVDLDQAARYAQASGDNNPIHLDDEAAKAVGQPSRILHGMCTLAFAARAGVEGVCGGDVGRLRRIAGRFSKPVFPGQHLTTTVTSHGDGLYGFEVAGPDGAAVRHGRIEAL